ncbi:MULTISPECIES: DNA-binding protein [unclassified Janthinobacterium]|uniref:DNA-binding protein n=1 Tax=unclassified Janthinobacterium TaxID=2610881 RepID=UPI000382EA4B|nr:MULTISPECIES: DNA-binding protein [unclassified Janthinobacterium]MEC5161341.1 chromosome segregation ATPase [Janthinobacterium sp. CG_S6]
MARIGILYSHVMKAAEKVAAEGKNPTVDSVREALGGTGSKSTIAPLLKRWKVEHQESVVAAETGVPAELLLAVKGLYQKLQADVGLQLAQASEAQRIALQGAAERLEQSQADNRNLSQTKLALAADLAQTKDELSQLRAEHHSGAITLAGLESDNAGLRARLADRAAEVAALNQQLAQARTQFEHYQHATAAQRTEERQAADQRVARLEQDLAGARQHGQIQQAALIQRETQLAQSQLEQDRWREAADALQGDLAAMRPERDQLAYQFKEASAAGAALAGKLATTQTALTEARIALAGRQHQAELLGERLRQAENKENSQEAARLTLIEEKAGLQAQLASRKR